MGKHTEGPWSAWHDGENWVVESEDRPGMIDVWLNMSYDMTDDEAEANAHLIAAAPDMLAALESALNAFEEIQGACSTDRLIFLDESEKARSAIAKSKGEKMEIDWSKAPEGATHWDTESNRFSKVKEGKAWFQSGFFWAISDADPSRFIPRPATWTGEGLPPVGILIEWADSLKDWLKVEVVGHYMGAVVAVDPDSPRDVYIGKKPDYRPIRTSEQIAAEERENFLCEVGELFSPREPYDARTIGERIYDAGYRKIK